MLCAVVAAAAALVAVGGPSEETPLTVICVELAAGVLRFELRSVAEIVAVALGWALAAMLTTPAALTVATAGFEELNTSPDAASGCVEPSV